MKYIKDIFNDYNIDNNIASSEVENVTLYKKSNKLQVNIASANQIKLNEIASFEPIQHRP